MSAQVESMAYQGETPWHGKGRRITNPRSVEATIVDSGLDWEVEKRPLLVANTEPGARLFADPVPDHTLLVRKSDGRHLDVVGARWTPLQNRDMFRWFQPWLDAGAAEFETAGSLQKGRRVFALAKLTLAEETITAGDTIRPYILLSNAHREGAAVRVGFTPIRVVCMNTLHAAVNDEASQLIRVTHSKNVLPNLTSIRDTMDVFAGQFRANAEQYRKLAAVGINRDDVVTYVQRVLQTEKETPKFKAMIDAIFNGRGAAPDTLWGAYNGVTHHLTWTAGRSEETRLDSLWFGPGAQLSRRALDIALIMAA